MTTRIVLWIPGNPAAQGSKAYKGHRRSRTTGRQVPVLVEQSKNVTPWRNAVLAAATQLLFAEHRGTWVPLDGALAVEVTFVLPKPASVTRALPTVAPDLDKLQRALFDGLTDAGIWTDDARVVTVAASKIYAKPTAPHAPASLLKYQGPGAFVAVTVLPEGAEQYIGYPARHLVATEATTMPVDVARDRLWQLP